MQILNVTGLKKVYTTRFGGSQVTALRQGDFSTGCDLYALKFIEFHDDPPA